MPPPGVTLRLILDGYNLIHRARGGFQKGDWNIVFNFFRGLRPMVEKYDPTVVYFVLEGNPKRNLELLPEYKATRPSEAPDGFVRQRDAIIDLLQHMPITLVAHPNFEADDVVYNLVTETCCPVRQLGLKHTFVVSSDSDFLQLLQRDLRPGPFVGTNDGGLSVYNWRERVDLERPDLDYVRWKALRGDPTDNIPKCPKMNDKKARDVVKDDLRFNELMQDADFKSIYERNLEVIRFQDFTPDDCKQLLVQPGHTDWDYVRSRFNEFGFNSMTNDGSWSKYLKTFKDMR